MIKVGDCYNQQLGQQLQLLQPRNHDMAVISNILVPKTDVRPTLQDNYNIKVTNDNNNSSWELVTMTLP